MSYVIGYTFIPYKLYFNKMTVKLCRQILIDFVFVGPDDAKQALLLLRLVNIVRLGIVTVVKLYMVLSYNLVL